MEMLEQSLYSFVVKHFQEFYEYPYLRRDSVPVHWDGCSSVYSSDDFVTCPTGDTGTIDGYIQQALIQRSQIPDCYIKKAKSDLMGDLRAQLDGAPTDGWRYQ